MCFLRDAVDTRKPPLMELALDCIQKLMSFKLLQGPVHHINHRCGGGAKASVPLGRLPAVAACPTVLAAAVAAAACGACRIAHLPVAAARPRRRDSSSKKREEGEEEGGGGGGLDFDALPPQAQAVELACRCDDVSDDGVELRLLKALLTAVTSTTLAVHGQALLLVVRACYNIFLTSRSDVNQATAKATLTQARRGAARGGASRA